MKVKLLLAALITTVFLVSTASANADWYMRYGQAKTANKEYAKEVCEALRECTAWGVGQCYRQSSSRFDCTIGTWFPPPYPGEEDIECQRVIHWGVTGGYIAIKGRGPIQCR